MVDVCGCGGLGLLGGLFGNCLKKNCADACGRWPSHLGNCFLLTVLSNEFTVTVWQSCL